MILIKRCYSHPGRFQKQRSITLNGYIVQWILMSFFREALLLERILNGP